MGQTIKVTTLEAAKVRMTLALRLLGGEDIPVLDEEEKILVSEFRGLRDWGFGRIEIIVVNKQLDGINTTRHKKRQDLLSST